MKEIEITRERMALWHNVFPGCDAFFEPHVKVRLRRLSKPDNIPCMCNILVKGKKASLTAYYVHTGDLKWWLYYLDRTLTEYTYLWEETEKNQVVGWVLFSPKYRSFDVFVDPEPIYQSGRLLLFKWAEEELMRFYKREGKKDIRTMWVSECDDTLISHLESRDFFCDDYYMGYRQQTLEVPSENPDLPPGYSIATVNKHEAGKRAAVSHAAFESGKGIEEYTENYRRFMDSPVYDPEMDLVVVAPEGRFAAFCLCWADRETKSGYIEPFGTHPEYRRRGLGKALLRTALIKLKTLRMETASICVEADNEAAENLYEATGFHRVIKIRTYVKNVL